MARILLVDDDPVMRDATKELLVREGHLVCVAGDGNEALKLFREHQYDLVVTDIFMPEVDGLELITTLKQDFLDVKVLVITGGGPTGKLDFLDIAKHLGAVGTLKKPFTRAELLEAVRRAIEDDEPADQA